MDLTFAYGFSDDLKQMYMEKAKLKEAANWRLKNTKISVPHIFMRRKSAKAKQN